ncbi:acetyl-CoA carboxylase [Halorientalis brevis]|uniref:Biotin carboxyl carrier protein of acetyl-CoA carboxylase n=1 Tax=Halorientalis brevis TaxID=1126241 RepID=A0ABD6CEX1_9EURY|nr:acetyl-CoA carboxylase [Halorientalis brevis]
MTTHYIEAPMPGVFYRRSDPDEPPYVTEGDAVSAGDVVGLVGVMKNFHDVTADDDGTVTAVLAENEQEIEAGDELLEIEVE